MGRARAGRPGGADYNVRIPYQVYDIAGLLREGDNAVGAILGDGWYCGCLAWEGTWNGWKGNR